MESHVVKILLLLALDLCRDHLLNLSFQVLGFDKLVVDGIVNGAGRVARRIGLEFRQMQSGQVQGYALWLLVGVNMIILILLFFTLKDTIVPYGM